MAYLSQTNPNPRTDAATGSRASPASETVTTLGRGLLITGNVVSAGAINVFGRVVGDIHAMSLTIAEGARVDGKVTVQEAVIRGAFKGMLYGDSVKLQGTAIVEGEVHNNSLSIEENAVFEGVARRLDRPVKAPGLEEIAAMAKAGTKPLVEPEALQLGPEHIVSAPSGIDEEVLA